MSELSGMALSTLVPGILGVYALVFIAGGIHCLEQRVARLRDQFPKKAALARLTGCAALAIGLLAALSIGGHFVFPGREFHLGALIAVVAGIAFWVHHLHTDLTAIDRVRDGLLVLACAMLAILTFRWVQTL